jgi:hypothetical protein
MRIGNVRTTRKTLSGWASIGEDGLPVSAIRRGPPLYQFQLSELRSSLYDAQNTVLACFSGTIAAIAVGDARELLDQVKGMENQGKNDEGFLSVKLPWRRIRCMAPSALRCG